MALLLAPLASLRLIPTPSLRLHSPSLAHPPGRTALPLRYSSPRLSHRPSPQPFASLRLSAALRSSPTALADDSPPPSPPPPRARTALDEIRAPQAGRYHLYVALGCPWATGVLAALKYKGLGGAIGHSVVHPTWQRTRPDEEADEHCGWHFRAPGEAAVSNALGYGAFECDGALVPDVVNGCRTVRELYDLAGDEAGKYSTPVLWCKQEGTIVCNESFDILKMLDSAFDELCEWPERRLFKPDEMAEAEQLNEWIYPKLNNGVYRAGFATTQEAYRLAHDDVFASLERLEERFASRESTFLTGDELTWLDIRLYMTLVRFDPVYVVYFKTSHKRIADYPNLLRFMRACYAIPAIKETTNMRHIKMHYFTSHPKMNMYGIIPEHDGPALE
ncbi:hypothetical protein AB1Y20_021608 [Prymnesium parvum]|uniref:GST C-terminal domain-containing protein n=1 Tax=Prymnesium parvum TaxID=97485 RepID=A0AB34JMR6_PRYPA